MPPASSETLYTDPRLSTVQDSRRRARMYAGEAELHGTIGSRFYHPRYGEKPLCLNLHVSNDDVASEATKKMYDGELHAESFGTTNDRELQAESFGTTNDAELHSLKHQEKNTTHPPEQPDESIKTTSNGELHAESLRTNNNGVLNAESVMTTTDAELHAEKHQEKTTTDEPEPPTRPPDKRLQNSPIPPASSYGMPPKSSNVLYRVPTAQASRRRSRTYAGEAELHGTIGPNLYHPQYGEKPLCLTLDVLNENVEKHLEKMTPDQPEQPDKPEQTHQREQPAEIIRTTNSGEFNAVKHDKRIGMTTDGEFKAVKHDKRIGMTTDGELNAESISITTDGEFKAVKHDKRIGMTNGGEFNAKGISMTTDGEFNAAKHDKRIGMKNAGPFNAERHQNLTAGSKASGDLDAQQLKKEVIRASTLWFASDRCYEDELRDGIG
jgi:hypothetical protein